MIFDGFVFSGFVSPLISQIYTDFFSKELIDAVRGKILTSLPSLKTGSQSSNLHAGIGRAGRSVNHPISQSVNHPPFPNKLLTSSSTFETRTSSIPLAILPSSFRLYFDTNIFLNPSLAASATR